MDISTLNARVSWHAGISLLSGNMAEMFNPEKLIQTISFDKINHVSILKDGRFRFIFQGMKGYREMSSYSFESTNNLVYVLKGYNWTKLILHYPTLFQNHLLNNMKTNFHDNLTLHANVKTYPKLILTLRYNFVLIY